MRKQSWSVNRLAAKAVVLHASESHTPGDPGCAHCLVARELLEVLGLVTLYGTLAPDDTRVIEVTSLGDAKPDGQLSAVREPPVDRSCLPPGLANPAPPTPRQRPPESAPRKQLQTPVCGTFAGRGRHERAGQPLCQECKDAAAEYQRRRRAARKGVEPKPAKPKSTLPARPETCGTLAGRANHLRRGEKLCRPCGDTFNTHQRAVRIARQAAAEAAARDQEKSA